MVGRGRFAIVHHNKPLWFGFGLRRKFNIWLLGTTNQPTFTALKQKGLACVVPPDLPTVVFMGPSLLWFLAFLAVLVGVGHTSQKVPQRLSIAQI